jgi:hypothetical protein
MDRFGIECSPIVVSLNTEVLKFALRNKHALTSSRFQQVDGGVMNGRVKFAFVLIVTQDSLIRKKWHLLHQLLSKHTLKDV